MPVENPEQPKLPSDVFSKLKAVVSALEAKEAKDLERPSGKAEEIELKISSVEMDWFVAYKTLAE